MRSAQNPKIKTVPAGATIQKKRNKKIKILSKAMIKRALKTYFNFKFTIRTNIIIGALLCLVNTGKANNLRDNINVETKTNTETCTTKTST